MSFFSFSDNRPPIITSPFVFFKKSGTALVKELEAYDPDDDDESSESIKFSEDTGSHDIDVSEAGVLTWAATENVNTDIIVTVTDECGVSTTQNVSLRIYNCQCKNNGDCQQVSNVAGTYTCECPTDPDIPSGDVSAYCMALNWSAWSECNVKCGGGKASRKRTCTGSSCSDRIFTQTRPCNTKPCARWSNWSFSECSATCGGGTKSKTRTCTGVNCSVPKQNETMTCGTTPCPEPPGPTYTDWSSWSSCSKTCDMGIASMTRTCTGTKCKKPRETREEFCRENRCPGNSIKFILPVTSVIIRDVLVTNLITKLCYSCLVATACWIMLARMKSSITETRISHDTCIRWPGKPLPMCAF